MTLTFKGRAIGSLYGRTRKVGLVYNGIDHVCYIPLSLITNEKITGYEVTDREMTLQVPDWFYEKNKSKLEIYVSKETQIL